MITSVSTSSTFPDLTNHQLKTFEKQIQKIIKKQKLEFTAHQQLFIWQFHCILWYMLSKDDLKYLGRCVKAKCECSAILYNGLEHLWSLVPMGDGVVAKINPLLIETTVLSLCILWSFSFLWSLSMFSEAFPMKSCVCVSFTHHLFPSPRTRPSTR